MILNKCVMSPARKRRTISLQDVFKQVETAHQNEKYSSLLQNKGWKGEETLLRYSKNWFLALIYVERMTTV